MSGGGTSVAGSNWRKWAAKGRTISSLRAAVTGLVLATCSGLPVDIVKIQIDDFALVQAKIEQAASSGATGTC